MSHIQGVGADHTLAVPVGLFGKKNKAPEAEVPAKPERKQRREPRFRMTPEAGGKPATVKPSHVDSEFDVFDLSIRGLSFKADGEALAFKPGDTFKIVMIFNEHEVSVLLRVAHRRDSFVGCEVIDKPAEWVPAITELINPMEMGRKLREINPKHLKRDPSGENVRWFQGGGDCDLHIWGDSPDGPSKVQLFFGTRVVEWSTAHGLRCGEVEDRSLDKVAYPESNLFRLRPCDDPELLETATRILKASCVPEDLQQLFARRV